MSPGECRWQQLQTKQGGVSRKATIARLLTDLQPVLGQVRTQLVGQEIKSMQAARYCAQQRPQARSGLAQAIQRTGVVRIAGKPLRTSSMQPQ